MADKLELIKNPKFENTNEFVIYTDGGCLVNPGGVGGFGVVILKDKDEIKLSQGYLSTTNNRMELRGPIVALENIPKGSNVRLFSDSKYFCDAINQGWIDNWLKNNWKNGTVKNIDLWKQFIQLYNLHHVEITWVKGHANNKYNEICDSLATTAYSDVKNLIIDNGYN